MNADHDADAMRRILAHAEELTQRDRRREAADWERQMRELMERRPAHMPPLSVAQGQGFVMVPRVPTDAMIEAMRHDDNWPSLLTDEALHLYAAMLAAAPAQPDGVE